MSLEKKIQILATALELFANESYSATATSRIAKKSGVSEGLIFKHFKSKKGLLDTIIAETAQRVKEIQKPIIEETDPKEVIKRTIGIPFSIEKKDRHYWMLQLKLKWQKEYNNPIKPEPVVERLVWAFSELKIPEPEKEAILLMKIVEATCISLIRDELTFFEDYEEFILNKYLK